MYISEILVVLLVALLVIKPAHLPRAAFTLGKWVKWFRLLTAKVKMDFEESNHSKALPQQKNKAAQE